MMNDDDILKLVPGDEVVIWITAVVGNFRARVEEFDAKNWPVLRVLDAECKLLVNGDYIIMSKVPAHPEKPPESEPEEILRTAFALKANWSVGGNILPPWKKLPELNRKYWRAVVATAAGPVLRDAVDTLVATGHLAEGEPVVEILADTLRTAFAEAAKWEVYGTKMVPWPELTQILKENWHAVARKVREQQLAEPAGDESDDNITDDDDGLAADEARERDSQIRAARERR